MISENLVQYIRDGVTTIPDPENQVLDSIMFPTDNADIVIVRPTGGTSRVWPDNKQEATFQIESRSTDFLTARNFAFDVWDVLRSAESVVTLPAADGVTGSAEQLVDYINVLQQPAAFGMMTESYNSFVFNVVLTYFEN